MTPTLKTILKGFVSTALVSGLVACQSATNHKGEVQDTQNQEKEKERLPNIILIMADDMGYECLSSYGSAEYQTPVLDSLATQGVRFEHCYSQPLSTPSRVKIMTGKYNSRNYTAFGHLDTEEKTFANHLKEAGYATCISGKWQLNGHYYKDRFSDWDDKDKPYHFGFDTYCLWQLTKGRGAGERFAQPLLVKDGEEVRDSSGYGPAMFTDFICEFIEANKDTNFFVYYPMVLVHEPFNPTPHSEDWADIGLWHQKDTAYFADMVAYSDAMVGRIVHKVDELGLSENTLILFTGDNGTHTQIYSTMTDGRIIQGQKGLMTDGGTRVPLIAYWKGQTPPQSINDDLIHFADFLPTLAQVAKLDTGKLDTDGQSFLPLITGKGNYQPRELFYMYYAPEWGKFENGQFVRNKDYKLYADGRFYRVSNDPLEQNPLTEDALTSQEIKLKEQFQTELDKHQAN